MKKFFLIPRIMALCLSFNLALSHPALALRVEQRKNQPTAGLEELSEALTTPLPSIPRHRSTSPAAGSSTELKTGLEEQLGREVEQKEIEIVEPRTESRWWSKRLWISAGADRTPQKSVESVVQGILFTDPRSSIKKAQFEYDPLGQLQKLSIEWRDHLEEVADQRIELEDGRIFHVSYQDGVPRVWIEKKWEGPWIMSGYDLQEKITDADGKILKEESSYVTVAHYLSPSGERIPALESFDHDEMVPFVESLDFRGKELSIWNHDFHPDDAPFDGVLWVGNWPEYLRQYRLAQEIIWVQSDPPSLTPRGERIVSTYDFDYLSALRQPIHPGLAVTVENISNRAQIRAKVQSLIDEYWRRGFKFSAVNFNRSAFSQKGEPDYSPPDQSNFILNALVSWHRPLLGEVVLKKVPAPYRGVYSSPPIATPSTELAPIPSSGLKTGLEEEREKRLLRGLERDLRKPPERRGIIPVYVSKIAVRTPKETSQGYRQVGALVSLSPGGSVVGFLPFRRYVEDAQRQIPLALKISNLKRHKQAKSPIQVTVIEKGRLDWPGHPDFVFRAFPLLTMGDFFPNVSPRTPLSEFGALSKPATQHRGWVLRQQELQLLDVLESKTEIGIYVKQLLLRERKGERPHHVGVLVSLERDGDPHHDIAGFLPLQSIFQDPDFRISINRKLHLLEQWMREGARIPALVERKGRSYRPGGHMDFVFRLKQPLTQKDLLHFGAGAIQQMAGEVRSSGLEERRAAFSAMQEIVLPMEISPGSVTTGVEEFSDRGKRLGTEA